MSTKCETSRQARLAKGFRRKVASRYHRKRSALRCAALRARLLIERVRSPLAVVPATSTVERTTGRPLTLFGAWENRKSLSLPQSKPLSFFWSSRT